jgi:hypothetical protein
MVLSHGLRARSPLSTTKQKNDHPSNNSDLANAAYGLGRN